MTTRVDYEHQGSIILDSSSEISCEGELVVIAVDVRVDEHGQKMYLES